MALRDRRACVTAFRGPVDLAVACFFVFVAKCLARMRSITLEIQTRICNLRRSRRRGGRVCSEGLGSRRTKTKINLLAKQEIREAPRSLALQLHPQRRRRTHFSEGGLVSNQLLLVRFLEMHLQPLNRRQERLEAVCSEAVYSGIHLQHRIPLLQVRRQAAPSLARTTQQQRNPRRAQACLEGKTSRTPRRRQRARRRYLVLPISLDRDRSSLPSQPLHCSDNPNSNNPLNNNNNNNKRHSDNLSIHLHLVWALLGARPL